MDTSPQPSTLAPALAVKANRKRTRRDVASDKRLSNLDMRHRAGRRFRIILAAIIREFGDNADPIRAAELARLRMLNEGSQTRALEGTAKLNDVVRVSNLVARKERELAAACRSRPAPVLTLADYLASASASEAEQNAEDVAEPEVEAADGEEISP